MSASVAMKLAATGAVPTRPEQQLLAELLPLAGAEILELGCGRAEHTRRIAQRHPDCRVLALEVDDTQHALNLQAADLPNVVFELAGAQEIPAEDARFDIALMFKSLHHVPRALMAPALREIRRVLRPGGLLYVSEPVFAGALNEIIRLFHDEQQVRAAAFSALRNAVAAGEYELVDEIFLNQPVRFRDFAEFERLIIGATHTRHHLTEAVHAEVRARFATHQTARGARFETPMRVDLLRRPLTAPR
jgi:ubiquinone/menaquinone biosynthesis C-methylase UbiE